MLGCKRIDAIYMEFIPEFMSEMNEDVAAFVSLIYSYGYVAFRIQPNGDLGSFMSEEELVRREFDGLNVVLLPNN